MTFHKTIIVLLLALGSRPAAAEEAPKRKIAVQALPSEAAVRLDDGCWRPVPYNFTGVSGDHLVTVGRRGYGLAEVPVAVSDRDLFVEVRLKRKRGYHAGLALFSIGASAVLPGLILTVTGAVHQRDLVRAGAPMLGAGAALALTGGLLLAFGGEREPEIFVAPLLDLGEFKRPAQ